MHCRSLYFLAYDSSSSLLCRLLLLLALLTLHMSVQEWMFGELWTLRVGCWESGVWRMWHSGRDSGWMMWDGFIHCTVHLFQGAWEERDKRWFCLLNCWILFVMMNGVQNKRMLEFGLCSKLALLLTAVQRYVHLISIEYWLSNSIYLILNWVSTVQWMGCPSLTIQSRALYTVDLMLEWRDGKGEREGVSLSMGCHMCAVHESHVEKVGAMSSLLLMTLIELIESCMLYISVIMCVSEWEESPNLQLFSFTTTPISITRYLRQVFVVHTDTHMHVHVHMNAHTHTHHTTHTYAHTHTQTCTLKHSCTHTSICTHTEARTHTYMNIYTHTRTCVCMHTCTHTQMHAHLHVQHTC